MHSRFCDEGDVLKYDLTRDRAEPTSLAQGITVDRRGVAALSASATGSILYRVGAIQGLRRLKWFDRSGQELSTVGEPDASLPVNLSLAPDGRRVALNRSTEGGNTDIWLLDLGRAVLSRFTFDPPPEIVPTWSPDGRRVIYSKVSMTLILNRRARASAARSDR